MDKAKFFAALRGGPLFPRGLSADQVQGLERLLDTWGRYFANDSDFHLAYNLGTSYHETAKTMQPIRERGERAYFNKYEPGTNLGRVLGNTQPGDGFRFRGEGDVQNTGRANAIKATKRLNEVFGLKLDLVAHPEQRGDPFVSAMSLFLGNKEGWWTGKDLLDYIDGIPESEQEDLREFANARRVVNGTDKAALIAEHAMVFYRAIQEARKAGAVIIRPAPIPPAKPVPEGGVIYPVEPAPAHPPQPPAPAPDIVIPGLPEAQQRVGWAGMLIAALAALFGRRG